MAKLCRSCGGPVCPICGGCIGEGECMCPCPDCELHKGNAAELHSALERQATQTYVFSPGQPKQCGLCGKLSSGDVQHEPDCILARMNRYKATTGGESDEC